MQHSPTFSNIPIQVCTFIIQLFYISSSFEYKTWNHNLWIMASEKQSVTMCPTIPWTCLISYHRFHFPPVLIFSYKDHRVSHCLKSHHLFHIINIMVNILYIAHDSHNHHAKCIIHKLFSVTFCTVALIIIIVEAQ